MEYEIYKMGNRAKHNITCKNCGKDIADDIGDLRKLTLTEIGFISEDVIYDRYICHNCSDQIINFVESLSLKSGGKMMNWINYNEENPERPGVYLCKCVDEIYCIYDDHRGYEDTEPYYTVLEFNGHEWEYDTLADRQRVIAWLDFPECTIGDD